MSDLGKITKSMLEARAIGFLITLPAFIWLIYKIITVMIIH